MLGGPPKAIVSVQVPNLELRALVVADLLVLNLTVPVILKHPLINNLALLPPREKGVMLVGRSTRASVGDVRRGRRLLLLKTFRQLLDCMLLFGSLLFCLFNFFWLVDQWCARFVLDVDLDDFLGYLLLLFVLTWGHQL